MVTWARYESGGDAGHLVPSLGVGDRRTARPGADGIQLHRRTLDRAALCAEHATADDAIDGGRRKRALRIRNRLHDTFERWRLVGEGDRAVLPRSDFDCRQPLIGRVGTSPAPASTTTPAAITRILATCGRRIRLRRARAILRCAVRLCAVCPTTPVSAATPRAIRLSGSIRLAALIAAQHRFEQVPNVSAPTAAVVDQIPQAAATTKEIERRSDIAATATTAATTADTRSERVPASRQVAHTELAEIIGLRRELRPASWCGIAFEHASHANGNVHGRRPRLIDDDAIDGAAFGQADHQLRTRTEGPPLDEHWGEAVFGQTHAARAFRQQQLEPAFGIGLDGAGVRPLDTDTDARHRCLGIGISRNHLTGDEDRRGRGPRHAVADLRQQRRRTADEGGQQQPPGRRSGERRDGHAGEHLRRCLQTTTGRPLPRGCHQNFTRVIRALALLQ